MDEIWDEVSAYGDRGSTTVLVMLVTRFYEAAWNETIEAEYALAKAIQRAEQARQYYRRTAATLDNALRLYAMARDSR
jgi:hypothetical protein